LTFVKRLWYYFFRILKKGGETMETAKPFLKWVGEHYRKGGTQG